VNSNGNISLINEEALPVKEIQFKDNVKYGSCTCSDKKLYVTVWETGSSIIEFDFTPTSIKFVEQWQSSITCSEQEIIHDIAYNNNTLALVIKDKTSKTVNMELRSSQTLERLWLCQLNIKSSNIFKFHCCSLNYNEWLMVDYENQQLLHVNHNGK
jgi:hypothetical protein